MLEFQGATIVTITRAVLHVTIDRPYAERLTQSLGKLLDHSFTCNEPAPGIYHVVPAPDFEEAYYTHWEDYYRGAARMFTVLSPTP
jgi:hypothetical protein